MFLKIMRSPDPVDYLTTDVELTSVADAIRAKGGTSAQLEYPSEFITAIEDLPEPGSITQSGSNITLGEEGDTVSLTELTVTQNGTYNTNSETAGYNPVIVNVQPSDIEEKDVSFIDYDGTILYSYTADEFADLSELPPNPSHNGLTAEGWNWSLSNAKAYVSDYKKLWIGQLYQTSDGATRIYIDLKEGNLSPYFGVCGWSGTSGVAMDINIDWGDGSSSVASPLNWFASSDIVSTQHTYSSPGQYCITVTRANNSGWYCFMGGGVSYNYSSSDIGSTILWGNSANKTANRCYQDAIIKFEQGDYCNIGPQAFAYCKNLSTIVISNHVSETQNFYEICESFIGCTSLKSLTLFGTYGGSTPDSTYKAVTYQLFKDCASLKTVSLGYYIQSGSSTNTNRFLGCFQNCSLISSIAIPSTATYIGDYAFSNCESLHEIYIPANVTTIGSSVFENCYSLKRIYFKSTTPPTVSNSNTWSNIASDCVIFVPVYSYMSYVAGTNYPVNGTYTYIGFVTGTNGTSLPSSISLIFQDLSYRFNATWYATKKDAINQTNAITTGNGKEIYARLEFVVP